MSSPSRSRHGAQPPLPNAISCWTFGWYAYVAADEPYADLDEAMRQTRLRGFDTIRICSMPSFVSRAIRTGSMLRIGGFGGVAEKLRWYNFRGGVTIDPTERLLALFTAARRHDVRVILSNWDFNQAYKFEAEPELYELFRSMRTVDEVFAHIETTLRDVLRLLEDEGLLDLVSVVELHNELEGMEVGPLSDVESVSWQGAKGTGRAYQHALRSLARAPIERTIDSLHNDFAQLRFTIDTVWPWTDPPPPVNQDVVATNMYLTDSPVLGEYLSLFQNGELWTGRVLDSARPLLRPGAPLYDEWREAVDAGWHDPYYPQCYLAHWADRDRFLEFFSRAFARVDGPLRDRMRTWLEELARLSEATGKPWYLGEGYAVTVPVTSLWDASTQSREFHSWVVDQALACGACGLTPNTLAAPENPDIWMMGGWLRDVNQRIREA